MSASRGGGQPQNKFCKLRNLRNESDVEQNFVIPLLDDLGFTEDYRRSKSKLSAVKIGKARSRRTYAPDWVCYLDKAHKQPVLIIDAKSPSESAEDGAADAQLYATVLRRTLSAPKPDQFCLGCNGPRTVVLHYDTATPRHALDFADCEDGNPAYEALKADLRRSAPTHRTHLANNDFVFKKPNVNLVRALFEACHKVIWKSEFKSPVPAFWEFCKLMFIKLHEDRKLHSDSRLLPLLQAGQPLPRAKVIFSVDYLERVTNSSNPNPIAAIFETIRDNLEAQVLSGDKKRIFERDEKLTLGPQTIQRVVELLEHHDLIQIDEDLNGRLFQTFLSATMRGKDLGQFFTPRTVVDFMCDIADLRVTKTPPHAPLVLDACCGTGGFLIEAMAKMTRQLKDGPVGRTLSDRERKKIDQAIKDSRLIGVDAGKDPPVARIARINMYLHGDGGSRIYSADALDKKVRVSPAANPELRGELKQLKDLFAGLIPLNADVALTNPPFSMSKEEREPDQRAIMVEYDCAFVTDHHGKRRLRSSLNSNVMFLERYRDLLKTGGRLITVIDESVLNTSTAAPHRRDLFRHFYIRAVFSLPQDAFSDAGANAKTSVLLLERKDTPSDDQPLTFFGRSENIGYRAAKLDESASDLPDVLAAYHVFQQTGMPPASDKTHWTEKTKFFVAKLTDPVGRIDFEWHDPRHEEMSRRLHDIALDRGYPVCPLAGQDGVCHLIQGKTSPTYVSDGVPILKVRNITGEGIDWKTDYVLEVFFDGNPKSHLKRGDVVVTTTGLGTIGRADVFNEDIRCMTDGHVTALRLNQPHMMEPDFLMHYLRSPLGQMQMERYTVGYTGQRELNDSDLALMLITFPRDRAAQETVSSAAQRHDDAALRARKEHQHNRQLARTEFERLLGL